MKTTLWHTEVSKTKGLFVDPRPEALNARNLNCAANEIALLEVIAANPGRGAKFYSKQLKRPYIWTIATLHQYEKDGVVESSTGDRKNSLVWRLT